MENPAMKKAIAKSREHAKIEEENKKISRFYNRNSILGNDWAIFYVIIGPRMTGKSYQATDYMCNSHVKYVDMVKNYWLRISDLSSKALLLNKADKLVDPDLKRKYNLDLTTKGNVVYNNGKEFCTVLPLASFGKMKGVAFYDKDYTGRYNIFLDEFQLEIGERRTSFDILYNFLGMCENLVRTTKSNLRVFLLGNTLEEASTILKAFDFIPEKPGRYYLKRKRCIIDNIPVTDEYREDRKGSVADILGGGSMSNFTNELRKDISRIYKGKLHKPLYIIKFTKDPDRWFTVWDGLVVCRYKGQNIKEVMNMRPYIGGVYSREIRQNIIDIYDAGSFKFRDLSTQAYFTDELSLLRKQ